MQIELKGKWNVYQQIVEEYRRFIRLGVFGAGEKLPSVRALAKELGVNPNTVEKAYSALEEEGLVKCLPKKGAYVLAEQSEQNRLEEAARKEFLLLKKSGLSHSCAAELLQEVYEEVQDD